jgi:hypothetical protein
VSLCARRDKQHTGIDPITFGADSMEVADAVRPLKDFAKSSARLVKRCTKPDSKGVVTGNVYRNNRSDLDLCLAVPCP